MGRPLPQAAVLQGWPDPSLQGQQQMALPLPVDQCSPALSALMPWVAALLKWDQYKALLKCVPVGLLQRRAARVALVPGVGLPGHDYVQVARVFASCQCGWQNLWQGLLSWSHGQVASQVALL